MAHRNTLSIAGGLVGMALVAMALVGCQMVRRYVCPEMRAEDCVRDAYRLEGKIRRDAAMSRMNLWNEGTQQVLREYDEFMADREARIRRTR